MMMNDVWKQKFRTSLNWGRIKGVIDRKRKWLRIHKQAQQWGKKNENEVDGLKALQLICIHVTGLSPSLCCCADRCSCSQINRVACISTSCLHAKNSLRQQLTEQAQTYWITPAHTHQHLTAIPTCKQHFSDTGIHFTPWYTCAWTSHASCLTWTLFWPQAHFCFTPKAHMYLSSCPFLQHPGPPGDNRLLCCQAAEPCGMGRMTTYVPLRDQPGTER